MASFLSCATKEIYIVIPILAILIDWFFVSKEDWSVFKKHLLWYSILGAAFTLMLARHMGTQRLLDTLLLNASVPNNRGNILTSHALYEITARNFFISQFKVIWHYFLMFFWPFGISVEYDWRLSPGFF